MRIAVVGILLVAVVASIFSIPFASSQSSGVSTTMTVTQPPAQGQCTILTVAFSAKAGQIIIGTYGSDVSINFYILAPNDLNAIQSCRLNPSARPLFVEEMSVGHNNPYRSLSFPSGGTYYFVFVYVRGPTQLTNGYATVELSYPSSIVILGSTASGLMTTVISITSSSEFTSLTPVTTTSVTPTTSTPASTPTAISTSSFVTSTSIPTTTVASTSESVPAAGSQLPFTSLVLVIGGIIVVVGGLIGVKFLGNRKRRTLSSYLTRIDSTYNEFAVDREECRTRLERLKHDAIEMLNEGKIDEGHFLMLDEKISEYLKELTKGAPKYKRTSSTDDHPSNEGSTGGTSKVKYCSNCGAKLSIDDKVCKRCGTAQ